MASEWQDTTLGDVLRLQRGFDLPQDDRLAGSYPVVASRGVVGTHNEAKVTGPGVIIGRSGSLGGSQYIVNDFWPLNTTLWVKDFKNNLPRFCYYLLKSLDLTRYNAGSGVPTLNRNHIHPLPARVPSLNTQRRIAHILGTLDDKIELNRRMNETLEATAEAIFKSWFIDFDPVYAKAEGRDTGLPAEIADLFPSEFEESEFGAIPRGWSVQPLSQLAELKTKSIQPKRYPDEIWEHYSIPAYDDGYQPQHDLGETIKSGKYVVPPLSVLVSKLNPRFPRIWLPDVADSLHAVCSTEFMPFVACQDEWRPFVYELFKSHPIQKTIKSHVTGSTGSRQRVKPGEIAVMQVLAPSDDAIAAFSRVAESLHSRILLNRRQNNGLAQVRDTLLPKLLNGEIELSDAQAATDEMTAAV